LDNRRVLIVDDDRSLLKSLGEILRTEGYSVDAAETGTEALEKSRSQRYDVALLDIKLPDIEGTELLRLVDGKLPQTIKIVITGYPSTENAVKALNLKADGYIIKPVNPRELLKTMEGKLREQSESENMTEEKVAKWIETRAQKL